MDFEKYINAMVAIRKENERRIAENFSECDKYIAVNYTDYDYVYNKRDEYLKEQGFLMW